MEILLTHGKVALVDPEWHDMLSLVKWFANSNGYAARSEYLGGGRGDHINREVTMHRLIMDFPLGMQVDHVNGDRLDNRRCNLRLCTSGENARNSRNRGGSSAYKGVHWDRRRQRWIAQISVNWERKFLGGFKDEREAAIAYNDAASRYYGTYARFNLLPD